MICQDKLGTNRRKLDEYLRSCRFPSRTAVCHRVGGFGLRGHPVIKAVLSRVADRPLLVGHTRELLVPEIAQVLRSPRWHNVTRVRGRVTWSARLALRAKATVLSDHRSRTRADRQAEEGVLTHFPSWIVPYLPSFDFFAALAIVNSSHGSPPFFPCEQVSATFSWQHGSAESMQSRLFVPVSRCRPRSQSSTGERSRCSRGCSYGR